MKASTQRYIEQSGAIYVWALAVLIAGLFGANLVRKNREVK